MPARPLHLHPAQKKKAPSALSQGLREAKSAYRGTAELPPPRILRMLLDAMRAPPCGSWAGDHGLDKHGRPPSLFASPLVIPSALCVLSYLSVPVISGQTKSAQRPLHGGQQSARVRYQYLIFLGRRDILFFIPSCVNKKLTTSTSLAS
jgi:hypothetical protein